MKRLFSLALLAAIVLHFSSCDRKSKVYSPTVTADYLIVGHTGAYVVPETKTLYYRITSDAMVADTTKDARMYPDKNTSFNFNYPYSQAKFDSLAKGILSIVPTELLSKNGASIGSMLPDGGYDFVKASIGSTIYTWQIEINQNTGSTTLQAFAARVRAITSN